MKKPELALPAGSLQAALQAFSGGADAVYLGLHNFSARKGATNFSLQQLSSLKQIAQKEDKRIYVALNTLVDDTELSEILPICRNLELLAIDGLIVQDYGLAYLIAQESLSIPLHSSTQQAVHTISGVQEMKRLGFSRVVLSRELTFKEISLIRKACPDIELKVFIHGALCYGFSGLCMASHCITERSANRGECAQICRSWFSYDNSTEHTNGFFFSMEDLSLGKEITRLAEIGIDSCKIEGRMKSPSYVRAAARYYRLLLDGCDEEHALNEARDLLHTEFSRKQGIGYLYNEDHKEELITVRYPGHRGIVCGYRGKSDPKNSWFEFETTTKLGLHDGLLIFQSSLEGIDEPIKFSLHAMKNSCGKDIFNVEKGEKVWIKVPPHIHIEVGEVMYKISAHDSTLSTIQESSLLPYRYPLPLQVTLFTEGIELSLPTVCSWMSSHYTRYYSIVPEKAHKAQPLFQNLYSIFSSPAEGFITVGELSISNNTPFDETQVFLPLSKLKEIRRDWYSFLDATIKEDLHKKKSFPLAECTEISSLPPRNMISNKTIKALPWVDTIQVKHLICSGENPRNILPFIEGYYYIPLSPILFDEQLALDSLTWLVDYCRPSRVGINNVGQLQWAQQHPAVACFADIYLYMTNSMAAQLFLSEVPNPCGMYQWVEREYIDSSFWPIKPSVVGKDFELPLFISRSCFKKDSLGLSCKECSRNYQYEITQQGNSYLVIVQNCLTVVLKQPKKN